MQQQHIKKAGGLLLRDRKLLLERHGGKDIHILPGGKIESGETPEQALVRELQEEFAITVKESDLEMLESFSSQAVHSPDNIVDIQTFLVKHWEGDITLHDGIEGIMWVDSKSVTSMHASTIAAEHVIPMLKKMDLLD